jgi:hypothetical protein
MQQAAWYREPDLFDHLVGAGEQCEWDRQAERLRSLEIDCQLKLGGLLNRKIPRIGAPEDFVHIGGCLAMQGEIIRDTGEQPSDHSRNCSYGNLVD